MTKEEKEYWKTQELIKEIVEESGGFFLEDRSE